MLRRARDALSDVASLDAVLTEMATAGVSIDPLLFDAVDQNRLTTATLLLDRGASVGAVDDRGRTALHYAVSRARVPCVRLLLQHGATVHVQDSNGHTPMATLILYSTLNITSHTCDCAKLLLSKGARLPAHHIVWSLMWNGEDDIEYSQSRFVKLLLDKHVDPNAVDPDWGETALQLVIGRCVLHARGRFPQLEAADAHRSIALLLEYGADPNLPSQDGHTPLLDAAAARSPEIVALLLRHGADVNAAYRSMTTLHVAHDLSNKDMQEQQRGKAIECARLIAIKLCSQQAFIYGGVLYKAGVTRDVRTLMMRAFCKVFTIEGAINMERRDTKRVA